MFAIPYFLRTVFPQVIKIKQNYNLFPPKIYFITRFIFSRPATCEPPAEAGIGPIGPIQSSRVGPLVRGQTKSASMSWGETSRVAHTVTRWLCFAEPGALA